MSKKRKSRKLTVTQQIMEKVVETQKDRQHNLTRNQYIRDARRFVKYCRETHNVKDFESCREYIQEYSDYLQQHDYTASTVHTYLSAVSAVWKFPLRDISKPIRKTAEYTRGRKPIENPRADQDLFDPKWSYVVEFQKRVGLRREELRHLKITDLVTDESGYPCVQVMRGKGGKYFLARILPEDLEFLEWYFVGTDVNEPIFPDKYFQNNLNFHKLRADHAKKMYNYYLERVQNEPGYRKQLEEEIKARWEKYNIDKKTGKPKAFDPKLIEGYYYLRGENRKLAIQKGLALYLFNPYILFVLTFVCLMLTKNKNPKLLLIFSVGVVYTVFLGIISQALDYVGVIGLVLSNTALAPACKELYDEIHSTTKKKTKNKYRHKKDLSKRAASVAVVCSLIVVIFSGIAIKCFDDPGAVAFERSTKSADRVLREGPLKGIVVNSDIEANYSLIINDLRNIKNNNCEKVLVAALIPWTYFCFDEAPSTFTTWYIDGELNLYESYYENVEKLPECIYVPETSFYWGDNYSETALRYREFFSKMFDVRIERNQAGYSLYRKN
ncbi:MAG: hypothetical protein E7558_08500 [Ruminococcaceae bacterium]|nr:hypothetical protein [Oscillospiraceae bacterium]